MLGCVNAPLGSSVVPKAFLWGHIWMGERGFERLFSGPIFHSFQIPDRAMFRVAVKERIRRVQFHVGLYKRSPGEFSFTQSLPLGALLDGTKMAWNEFSVARIFSRLPCRLVLCIVLLGKSEPGGSSCMRGCIKSPLASSVVPKAFLWGHFWMGEWRLKRVFWGPIFESSAMRARVIFRVAVKE